MTEQEWLASEDPAAMLRLLNGEVTWRADQPKPEIRRPSDRKLRLWVEACRERWPLLAAHTDLNDPTRLHQALAQWASTTSQRAGEVAALLRDIAGNPWRPVTLPRSEVCPQCDGYGGWASSAGKRGGPGGQMMLACQRCDGEGRLCPWLTPTVLSLAQAAYDERAGRKCDGCVDGDVGCSKCEGAGCLYVPPYSLNRIKCDSCNDGLLSEKCGKCGGTGRIDDGTLDPARLSILADALEEAGCTDEHILRHLRGWEPCPGEDDSPFGWMCDRCGGSNWVRSTTPHVRGFFVLDIILGKE